MNTKTTRGLRMRALCQVLLGTGMRISEALSLNRNDIDWAGKEARVVGKGSKPRVVYFSEGALCWLKKYLDSRKDDNPALFVTFGSRPKRLQRYDLSKSFRHYGNLAGISKRLTPHILRHDYATMLVANNCNLFAILQMLGHSDIKTTAKYYLGVDKAGIKSAHDKFLRF